MEHVMLNTGAPMPSLGFGVFQIPEVECQQAVETALAAGYRLLDTAASYLNERAVGAAIKACGVPREELFVTTKLWIQRDGESGAAKAFAASLDKLGLDYVDLYLIHQPYGDWHGEWRTLERLHLDGYAKAIGVSNFAPFQVADLIAFHDVVPAVNQIETHPFHQQTGAQEFLASRGVAQESWGPLAEGKFDIFTNPVLTAIAQAHGKSVAQVVLRWLTQRGVVAIPKSVRPERIAENIDIFDFTVSDDELARIAALDTGQGFFNHFDPNIVTFLAQRALD
jgi:diketogulonate reductase-like aldo/keto reductase